MAATEGPLPPQDAGRPASARSDSSLSNYNLQWLFDPNRIDHLPIEEQLKLYKQRDLKRAKIYKFGVRIWGGPSSRRRRIIAAPLHPRNEEAILPTSQTQMTSALKPQQPPPKRPSSAELRAREEKEKQEDHDAWMKERRHFRQELDTMGLDEAWLANKPNKSPLEMRLLKKMIAERNAPPPTPPPEEDPPIETSLPSESPVVRRPSPLAIRMIERYLHANNMRLIDLFLSADKDKDWMVSRDEFRRAIQKAGIPISEVLLEDLILSLDTDFNNELDYRELAKGMGLWKLEKRESKRKMLASGSYSPKHMYENLENLGYEDPDFASLDSPVRQQSTLLSKSSSILSKGSPQRSLASAHRENAPSPSDINNPLSSPVRLKSALSTISSGSGSQFLEPPEGDLRPEQMILSSEEAMVELRKRDRETLARYNSRRQGSGKGNHSRPGSRFSRSKTILTGDKAIDDHCKLSTLEGETGELVNKFRRLKMREFEDVCKLCHENHVPLSEDLLKKALLFPPDNPHSQIAGRVRQPTEGLFSTKPSSKSTNVKSSKAPAPDAVKSPNTTEKKKRDVLSHAGPNAYPTAKSVAPSRQKKYLSTGKAFIARQVDCWLTFEEYDKLTQNLARRYDQIHGPSDDNAFWPGHLLTKLRLCMPNANDGKSSIFNPVLPVKRTNVGYHNDLNTWPSDLRCVKYGSIDK